MGVDLPDLLPDTSLNDFNYYMDTQRLRIAVSNMKNANTREELEEIKTKVLQHLSKLPPGEMRRKQAVIVLLDFPPVSHETTDKFVWTAYIYLYLPVPFSPPLTDRSH